jgi:hypothetical protein
MPSSGCALEILVFEVPLPSIMVAFVRLCNHRRPDRSRITNVSSNTKVVLSWVRLDCRRPQLQGFIFGPPYIFGNSACFSAPNNIFPYTHQNLPRYIMYSKKDTLIETGFKWTWLVAAVFQGPVQDVLAEFCESPSISPALEPFISCPAIGAYQVASEQHGGVLDEPGNNRGVVGYLGSKSRFQC